MTVHDLDQLREARIHDLRVENVRLREALHDLWLTLDRSDPFYVVWMERYGDLVPTRERPDAA